MKPHDLALVIALAGAVLSGCAATAERRQVERDTSIFVDGDRLHTGTGATFSSGAGGNVSNETPAPASKEPRANTPPGTDRGGNGPASGAIVDPAGVTEKPAR